MVLIEVNVGKVDSLESKLVLILTSDPRLATLESAEFVGKPLGR
jgi:hypothetical protein